MKPIGNILKNKTTRTLALATAGLAGLIVMPTFASAASRDSDRRDHRDDRRRDRHDDHRYDRHDEHDRSHSDVRVNINLGGPRYEDRVERVWVGPVYQTVCDRVWVTEVTRDDCVRVWVPDRFEVRSTIHPNRGSSYVTHERVLAERGHYEDQHRTVVVREGHWENVERQELVTPGHFEERHTRVQTSDNPWIGFFGSFGR